jgi:hypothetical protein
MDTIDQFGVMAYTIAMVFMTGGIATFYGHDLTQILTYTLGGITTGLTFYMSVAGIVLIFATNRMSAKQMFDVYTVEGIAGVFSLAIPAVLVWNPTFVSNFVADPLGGFVVALVGVISTTILATFPY